MPRTGAGGLGGVIGRCDEVTGGRVARRGRSHTSHRILLAVFTMVQLLHCHSRTTTQHNSFMLSAFSHYTEQSCTVRAWFINI